MEDERYTGVYVIGKRAVLEVGGTRSRLKDRESWYIIPNHHPAIVEKSVFDTVQASQLRFSQPNKKKRDYPLKGRAFCGCCGHALSRTMQKTSYYYCRHSEADEESRCHKMRLNAAELEQAVFLTLKKQMEAAAPLAPDGTLRVDASVPERTEYEQQIEALQDGKRALYERYLMGEIDLNTYKAEKAACDELLLKTKNAYAAVLAQAKQKQDEQARQDSRKEASKAIFDADTLTTELAELLIDRVLVYPDKRIEIAYKIHILKLLHPLHLQFLRFFPRRFLFCLFRLCGFELRPDGGLFLLGLSGLMGLGLLGLGLGSIGKIGKGNLFPGFYLGLQLAHGWGVIDNAVNHVFVLLCGQLGGTQGIFP